MVNPMDQITPNETNGAPLLGKSQGKQVERTQVLILGSGPAGYTAAIYAARANLNPVLYEGLQPGGQLTTTTEVENFPGYPNGVTGPELMDALRRQAQRFGTDVRYGIAVACNLGKTPYTVTFDDGKEIETETLIIATGATAKYLGLESEERYKGQGVSACATCDGFFYKGMDVAVVGGGDTACEEASYLAGMCRKVYLVVRKPYLRASKAMQERVNGTKNIEILFEHTPKEVLGDARGVNGFLLTRANGDEVRLSIAGLFVAIGHVPNSLIFKQYLDTDEAGYIITQPGSPRTNIAGVFACGDVQDKHYKQAITAAGSGCMAALDAERYLGARKF